MRPRRSRYRGCLAPSARASTWLWATRQLKSRSQTAAVRAGHVRVNGARQRPPTKVRVGDEVRHHQLTGCGRPSLLLNRLRVYPQACTADDRTPRRPRVRIPVANARRGQAPTKENGESWTGCADTISRALLSV